MQYIKIDGSQYLYAGDTPLDLSGIPVDLNLSGAGFIESENLFWASFDQFQTQGMATLVANIVYAHGYEINIENILCSLDSIIFTNLVRFKNSSEEDPVSYLPAVKFKLPNVDSKGILLTKFYDEINFAIGQGMASSTPLSDDNSVEKEKVKLERQIDYLSDQLKTKQESSSQQAIVAIGNVTNIPHNVKFAKIEKYDSQSRIITLKSHGKLYKISTVFWNHPPQINEYCLINVNSNATDEKIISLSQKAGQTKINHKTTKIVAIDAEIIKVKATDAFEFWQIKTISDTEKTAKEALKVADKILLTFVDGEIFKWKKLDIPLKQYEIIELTDEFDRAEKCENVHSEIKQELNNERNAS